MRVFRCSEPRYWPLTRIVWWQGLRPVKLLFLWLSEEREQEKRAQEVKGDGVVGAARAVCVPLMTASYRLWL